jgi:hypothetical protein
MGTLHTLKRLSLLLVMLCVSFSLLTPLQAEAQQPAYGSGIVVDGDIGDWDLNSDFYAEMYMAGNPDFINLSTLYLRYDCATSMLFALVLDIENDGWSPDYEADEAWIKFYDIGWSNNLLIDGNGGGNTIPRCFQWVFETPGDENSPLLGYEACASLDAAYYYSFEAHLNIDGETSSTGKESHGDSIPVLIECTLTDIELPQQVTLNQNYPNPFNPTTTIDFDLVEPGNISLRVFDLAGHEIATLVDGHLSAGNHTVFFDASDLATGVYYYTLQAAGVQSTRKMLLVK